MGDDLISAPRVLPCPFCGAEPRVMRFHLGNTEDIVGVTIECLTPNCPASPISTGDAMCDPIINLTAWNRRALPSATQAGGWMPPDIDAIENGGKRWHGEDHRVVSVRWEPYKPDGQRQMKAKGRWQEQVGSGDYWRWQNCERPAFAPLPPAPEGAD